jgi:stress response protein YsnF
MTNSNITIPDTKNRNQIAQFTSIITDLNNKIGNFEILDKNGQIIGNVKEVILDSNRKLSFIVTDNSDQNNSNLNDSNKNKTGFFLLKGQLVQKIDTTARRIISIIDKAESKFLPEYLERIAESESNPETTVNSNQDNSNFEHQIVNGDNPTLEPIRTEIRTVEEDILKLLGEKLIVDRTKRKIGEVIIRKEIETRMVTVPVRRERLIVEQISPENKQLANIDLGEEQLAETELLSPKMTETINLDSALDRGLTVSGEFTSPKIASLLLNAIAMERDNGCTNIRITIAVDSEQHQQRYQEWFTRTSAK